MCRLAASIVIWGPVRVVLVPDSGRWGPLPPDGVLGLMDLPAAVSRIGLEPGDPVFVSPDFTVDPGLLDFVRSRDFRSLERETRLEPWASGARDIWVRINPVRITGRRLVP